MYKVVQNLTVKVQGVIKTFPVGSVVNLPEKAAQMFIQQGKLKLLAEERLTGYELSERMAIQGENCEPNQAKPYVTKSGVLVIPVNSSKKYYYWETGGQGVCETLKELGRCDLLGKYKSFYSN